MTSKCIICDIEGSNFGNKDYLGKNYTFSKCNQCGLWWVKNISEDYEKLYETTNYWWDYHKSRGWNSIDETPRIENDLKYSLLRLPEIQKFVKSGTALEIGCSTGTMLKVLKENGFNPFGVEPNFKVAQQAIDYSDCDVFSTPEKAFDFKNQSKFDLIIALDVLEHLRDPLQNIKNWVDLCKKDGIIMIELPDSSCEGAVTHGINWDDYCIPTEHIYYFKPSHIKYIFKQLGCSLLEFSNPWTTDRMRFFFKKN